MSDFFSESVFAVLRVLNVSKCGVRDHHIEKLCHNKNFAKLQELCLAYCLNITNKSFEYLLSAEHLNFLHKLDFTGT